MGDPKYEERCKASVPDFTGFHFNKCARMAKLDGYCTQHHPKSVGARRNKKNAKREALEANKRAAFDAEIRSAERAATMRERERCAKASPMDASCPECGAGIGYDCYDDCTDTLMNGVHNSRWVAAIRYDPTEDNQR